MLMFTAKRMFARGSQVRVHSATRRGLATTRASPKNSLPNEKVMAGTLLSVGFGLAIWAFKPVDLIQQESKLSVQELSAAWDTFDSKATRMTDEDDDDDEEDDDDATDPDDEDDDSGVTVELTDIDSEYESEKNRRLRECTPMPKDSVDDATGLEDEDDDSSVTVELTDIDSEYESEKKRRIRECTPMPKD